MRRLLYTFSIIAASMFWCLSSSAAQNIATGADRTDLYLPLFKSKRIALVINHTSVVKRNNGSFCPLPDTLLRRGVDVACIMAPEHGYQGTADAGAHVANSSDGETGLPIYSLYGKNKKPRAEWLENIDLVVFDMQDVGARFYTYLSTLYYLIEACGEQQKPLVILDRPNPNDTIDGPTRDKVHHSFVGIVGIPLLHGCTLGELAEMICGERWVATIPPSLTVIKCLGWQHGTSYEVPIAPSPNLPNAHAIALYPSLCLLEATEVSVGRGTPFPFQVYGHPDIKSDFCFTPRSSQSNKHPLQENKECRGQDLRAKPAPRGFSLFFLMDVARSLGKGWITSPRFFDLLAGNSILREQIDSGLSADSIRQSWQADLQKFRTIRNKYLLYEDYPTTQIWTSLTEQASVSQQP